MNKLDINVLCAILRLYAEMDVQQTTLYEEIGKNLEKRYSELEENGLVNALVAFKQAPTIKQMPVMVDLEKILIGNIR